MPRYATLRIPESCRNISIELAKRALTEAWGNVSEAADALGIPSRDLRLFVRITPELTEVAEEASEIYCDKAEAILREALESPNELRRDVAARFVLSGKGMLCGWKRPTGPAVTIEEASPLIIRWLGENEAADMENGWDDAPVLIGARPGAGQEPSSG